METKASLAAPCYGQQAVQRRKCMTITRRARTVVATELASRLPGMEAGER